jgi:amino acid permease
MHYNAARFYTELKDKSLSRFAVAVSSSFGVAAVMYIAIASLGFLTFGANSAGYILNNYSPYDPLATGSRLCVGLAVLVSCYLII